MEITYNSNDEKSIQEVLDEQVKNASLRNLRMHPGYEHALKMVIPPFATITFSVERFIALLCELENINENFIDM